MLSGEGPQWLPMDLEFTPPALRSAQAHLGCNDPIAAFNLDSRLIGFPSQDNARAWRDAYADLGIQLADNAEVGHCGITQLVPPRHMMGSAWHLREMLHPLSVVEDVRQLEALPWPSLCSEDEATVQAQVANAHEEGRFAFCRMECTVFEIAWYLRGMENLFVDLVEENEIGGWLLDWFMERSIAVGRVFARAGAGCIGLGDDVGTQHGMLMSMDLWRRWLKPRLQHVIDAIRSEETKKIYIRYHSDGDIRPIIDDLIEIGVDILNPVQPECMPLPEVIAGYQDRVAFWGAIGTQSLMPFGSPKDVHQAVQELAHYVRGGARIVVAPTHALQPDVPWENICALVNAVKGIEL